MTCRGVALGAVLVAAAAAGASAQPNTVQPTPGAPAISTAAGRCGVCHPSERVLFEKSRHAQEEVRCASCHGGDDAVLDFSIAHGKGFRGRPSRKDIPALCASCHADEAKMRPYDLPVDQYALYQISGHGQRLARGDTRVAVCSDCHGAHDILPAADPASRVFSVNIPKTCGGCHGDSALMVRERRRRDTYREYLSSVHAHELFDKGNRRAPTCVSCHGVHGAAPPELGDVGNVCGQCHTAERRYFTAGPHRAGLIRAGKPECVSCHGDHAIGAAQPERLATLCQRCHAANSPPVRLGRTLWTEYRTAASEVDQAAALIAKADAVPIQTDDYRARLEEARTHLRETLPSAHSVQEDVVAVLAGRARSVGREIESEIHEKLEHLKVRKLVLIVFWFYLLLTILVLRRFRERASRS